MRPDIVVRLLPFTAAYVVVYIASDGAGWLGLGWGRLGAQLVFAAVAAPVMFFAAAWVQLLLARRRGALSVPAGPDDAAFQAGFYVLNGPIEEAFFRGMVQGGLTALWAAPIGLVIATTTYVLYHKLGRWSWADTFATTLVGVPLGLAYWLLPGPPSLLGVSIAHVAATCGFLGPGPFLLHKMRLV